MPRITNLPVTDDLSSDDYLVVVDQNNGTPVTRRTTVGDLASKVTTTMAGLTFQGEWEDSPITYAEGDVVSYDGSLFINLTGSNSEPDTDPAPVSTADWQLWVPEGPPGEQGEDGIQGDPGENGIPAYWETDPWSAQTYAKGTAVFHEDTGNTWVAVEEAAGTDIPGAAPPTPWVKLLQRGTKPWKPRVVGGEPTQEWETGIAYSAGTDYTPAHIVAVDGSTYHCVTSHTSGVWGTDLANNKWALVASKGDTGQVQAVVAGAHISVDDSDVNNPVVAVDVPALTDDATFQNEVLKFTASPTVFRINQVGYTFDGADGAWKTLTRFHRNGGGTLQGETPEDWEATSPWITNGDYTGEPDYYYDSRVRPGATGLWKLTVHLRAPINGTNVRLRVIRDALGGGDNGNAWVIYETVPFFGHTTMSVTWFVVVGNADSHYALQLNRVGSGSSFTIPARGVRVVWEYMSSYTGTEVPPVDIEDDEGALPEAE